MPGYFLHLGAVVTCSHGGQATATVTNPRVLVSGMPIATLSTPYAIAGCAFPPPPAGNGPCVTGNFTMGSTRILANGVPVLLGFPGPAPSTCVPTGTPLMVASSQVRVKGI